MNRFPTTSRLVRSVCAAFATVITLTLAHGIDELASPGAGATMARATAGAATA